MEERKIRDANEIDVFLHNAGILGDALYPNMARKGQDLLAAQYFKIGKGVYFEEELFPGATEKFIERIKNQEKLKAFSIKHEQSKKHKEK